MLCASLMIVTGWLTSWAMFPVSRRAERLELAKEDFDASLAKHATEEIEMARVSSVLASTCFN